MYKTTAFFQGARDARWGVMFKQRTINDNRALFVSRIMVLLIPALFSSFPSPSLPHVLPTTPVHICRSDCPLGQSGKKKSSAQRRPCSLIPRLARISRRLRSFSSISCLSPTTSSSLNTLPMLLLLVVKAVSSREWRFCSGLSGRGSDLMTRQGLPAAMV